MQKILNIIYGILNVPLLPVGKTTVTLALLLYIITLFAFLIMGSRSFRRRVLERVLAKSKLDINMQNAFAMLLQYSIIGIGIIIILNTAGIEMGALTVLAGAMGIGLSLGMQTIAKNVAGGVMILIERPIRIGDRIQIGTTTGDVTHIALRATTIRNDDHIDIIVPNSDFMDQRVSNWTYSSRDVILNIPILVSSENEVSEVREILFKSMKAHSKILDEPVPNVLLDSFEGGKLKFIMRLATNDYVSASTTLKSDLLNDILQQFKQCQVKL